MTDMNPSKEGTGILIPSELWSKALPTLKRRALRIRVGNKEVLGEPEVDLRLRSGQLVEDVVVGWNREILFRGTGLRGPECTTEGLDFKSDDIVAIGVVTWQFLGLWDRVNWFTQ